MGVELLLLIFFPHTFTFWDYSRSFR